MHFVILNILFRNWSKSSYSHVECHKKKFCPFVFHFFQKLRSKMKPCCRCGGRALKLRIYRLVFIFILQLFMDIRRRRHFSQLIQPIIKITGIMKLYQSAAKFRLINNSTWKILWKFYFLTRQCFTTRIYKNFPNIISFRCQKKCLHFSAGFLAPAK